MSSRSKTKQQPQPDPRWGRRDLLLLGLVAAVGASIPIGLRTLFDSPMAPSPTSEPPAQFEYLSPEQQFDLPETQINFAVAALALTRDYVPGYQPEEGLKQLDEIAARVKALLAQQPDSDDPMIRIAAINTVLFREYQFGYDLTDFPRRKPETRLLGNLLRRSKGTCANLPDLYYAVAERLGFPIYMVEAPQHVFLRYVLPNGEHINIEATGAGGQSSDEDYIAEMEIPKAALDSGTFMRTLSRREALFVLMQERTFFDEWRGDFQQVLQQGELLRKLRPGHAPTQWNAAISQAIAGRANRAAGKTDPEFAVAAEESFARARAYAKRAVELGVIKPDNKGEYVERERAIRRARLGEGGAVMPSPEPWDAVKEIEEIIKAPPSTEFDTVRAYRVPNPNVPVRRVLDPALEKELAMLRELDEVNRLNQQERARTDAIFEAAQRYNRSVRQDDKMQALEDLMRANGPREPDGAPTSPSGRLSPLP